jgi:hypothetical protein
VRFWPVGSYLIVHRGFPTALQILGVFHGAREVKEVIRKW